MRSRHMMEVSPMIARNWRNLKRPRGIQIVRDEECYGRYIAEPLERGYGYTIGNALKCILLSSVRGSAIIGFEISNQDANGQIQGVQEDAATLALNLKEVECWTEADELQTISCDLPLGEVYLKDLQLPESIQALNPEHFLCNVEAEGMTLTLSIHTGYGYVVAEDHTDVPQSMTAIDATFSPIKRVDYQVSNARVGQRTDYDKLSLNVWTNGALSPQDAIMFSAKLFREQMTTFINFKEEEEVVVVEEEEEEVSVFHEYLDMRVSELDLPVRAANCLRSANITYIGELVQRNEKDMVDIKNFGKKSLTDINEVLSQRGLSLGMVIQDWVCPE
jgi:DNA-directed RNA polymerase subunit alpha